MRSSLIAVVVVLFVSATAQAQPAATHWVGTWGAAAAWRPPIVATRPAAVPLALVIPPASAPMAPSEPVSTAAASANAPLPLV